MAGPFRWTPSVKRFAALAALLLTGAPAGAVDYLNVTVQPDRAVPGACFTFTAPLPRKEGREFELYVAVEPATDHALQPRGKDLCVTGFAHGKHYAVRLKAGLPAADGTALAKDVSVAVDVPDREASLGFENGKTLLPYAAGVGLPLKSVNVSKAHVALYRLGDRGLADQVGNGWFGQALTGYTLGEVADRASKLFEGRVDIASKPNQQVTTALPIDQLVKALQPGGYAAVATPDGRALDDDAERATQWFSVSDVGLLSVKTEAGMLVVARSLQSASRWRASRCTCSPAATRCWAATGRTRTGASRSPAASCAARAATPPSSSPRPPRAATIPGCRWTPPPST